MQEESGLWEEMGVFSSWIGWWRRQESFPDGGVGLKGAAGSGAAGEDVGDQIHGIGDINRVIAVRVTGA
jgi:hypothetical protein